MNQEERWLHMWKKYMDYLNTNRRCPSKYKLEEKKLVNWVKHNRKLRNKGLLVESRQEKFQQLVDLSAKYRRVNKDTYLNREALDNALSLDLFISASAQ